MTRLNSSFNFGPGHHSILGTTLGYDTMFHQLERLIDSAGASGSQSSEKYPPHNIFKIDEYNYIVELAVAGFSKEEIDINVADGVLTIEGNKKMLNAETLSAEKSPYLHKGISTRSFTKTIHMVDTVEVLGADYANGILSIRLENVIPESKKPRNIEIRIPNPTGVADTKQFLKD